jgi:DNA polymerase-3 subunit alpha
MAFRGVLQPITEALAKPEGSPIAIGGVIATVKNIQTKKNDTMAFVKLVDTTGSTEVIVFPSVYKLGSSVWTADRPVVVSGKISSKDGVPKVIADRAEVVNSQTVNRIRQDFGPKTGPNSGPLEAPPAIKAVSLTVPVKLAPATVTQLRAVFEKYPGPAPIELVYFDAGRACRLRTSFAVEINNELKSEIENILGNDSVKF